MNKATTLQSLLKGYRPFYLPTDKYWHWEVKDSPNGIVCDFVGREGVIDPADVDIIHRELSMYAFIDKVVELLEPTKYYVVKHYRRAVSICDSFPPYGIRGYKFMIGIKVKPRPKV